MAAVIAVVNELEVFVDGPDDAEGTEEGDAALTTLADEIWSTAAASADAVTLNASTTAAEDARDLTMLGELARMPADTALTTAGVAVLAVTPSDDDEKMERSRM